MTTSTPPSKNKWLRKWMVRGIAAVVIVVLVAGYPVVSLSAYNTLSLPAPRGTRFSPAQPYENVTFSDRNGDHQVHAFYMPGNAGMPALISVHGWRGTRYAKTEVARADALRSLGYTVLSVDLADGPGDTVDNGRISMGAEERYDVLGGFDYLLTRGFGADQIGLVGGSMGAATVLLAAGLEPRIRAVWADSPYSRAEVVAADQAESFGFPRFIVTGGMIWGMLITGVRMWEIAAIDQAAPLAASKTQIYLLHCTNDNFVFYGHSQAIEAAYKAAGVELTTWYFACQPWPDSTLIHTGGLDDHRDEYLTRLDHFFRAHLRSTAG